jgi:ABC-2 type transport system permease protein
MRELLLVLNLKAASFLKGVLRPDLSSQLKNLASVIVFGAFAIGTFIVARVVTEYLLDTAHIGLFLLHRFLSMALYVFFITVNIGNIIVCFATLYRSDEVAFMMSLPISHAKIFLVRFVDNFFYSSSTLALIGVSAILGYGSYFHLPWYFFVFFMFGVFLPFMLIAGIIAVLLLMGLIKIASRIGVRLLVASVSVVYLLAVYVYFHTTNPVGLVSEVMEHYPGIDSYFGSLDPPLVGYLPSSWVSEFLYWSVNGNTERAIPYFFLLFFTMIGFMAVAGLLARKYYYRTWLTASDAQAMKGTRNPSGFRSAFLSFDRTSLLQRIFLGREPQSISLFKRDFWMFFREPSQWLHLLLMVVLILIFLISIRTLDFRLGFPLMRAVGYMVVFLFIGFLMASIALRFVFPAASLEGKTFWAVRSSPLDLKKLYFFKLKSAVVPAVLLAELLVFGSLPHLSDDSFLVIVGAISGACAAVALTSLHLGAGTYFAMYRERNPIRVASSHGATLAFLGSMVYLCLLVLILVVPLNRYFESRFLPGTSLQSIFYVPLAVICLLTTLVTYVTTRVGIGAIQRDY